MRLAANIAVAFVALSHIGFLYLEMFLWTKPAGRRIFRLTPEIAEGSRVLAANQGLYNGFLAAGLIWGLITSNLGFQIFFLVCAIVAGIFGAATAKVSILFGQALPAAIALALVLMA